MNINQAVDLATEAALEGRRALVAFSSTAHAREAFAKCKDSDSAADWKFRSKHGVWQITHKETDGTINFLSVNSQGHRGLAVDEVYLPQDADEKHRVSLAICVAASPNRKMALYS